MVTSKLATITGVGRSQAGSRAGPTLSRARAQGLRLENLALATGRVHATKKIMRVALEELERKMNEFLGLQIKTPGTEKEAGTLRPNGPRSANS